MVVSYIDECVCGDELASPQVLLIFQQRLGDFSPAGRMVMGCCTSDLSHSCWAVFNSRCGLKERHLSPLKLNELLITGTEGNQMGLRAKLSLNNADLFRSLDLRPKVPLRSSQTIPGLNCSVRKRSRVHVPAWSSYGLG